MKEDIVGSYDWKGKLDLLNIVMIGLAKEIAGHDEVYELHRLPGALLSKELTVDEKLNLREIDRGTKYYAVMLTFIDKNDEKRILETYANSFDFQVNDEEIKEYFRIGGNRSYGNPILTLYGQLNEIMPTEYSPLQKKYYHTVLEVIDQREHNEGFCCYKARHNGKKANGEQINISFGKKHCQTSLQVLKRFGGFLLTILLESNFRNKKSMVQYPGSYRWES